jgi:acetyltransferase-like isoleucine patch superfamily enzyme
MEFYRGMKKIIKEVIFLVGKVSCYVFPQLFSIKIVNAFHYFYSIRVSSQFSKCGENPLIKHPCYIKGANYIKIGTNFRSSYRFKIEAWDKHEMNFYEPTICIGDNVSFSDNCHIGAINCVLIGNNVLVGSNVYITDHNHGNITVDDLKIAPNKRQLFSKGPVIIEDNVWIGDSVIIMPNVVIGHSSIIGANSVVTKSFPPNSIIAGSPSKVIKTFL